MNAHLDEQQRELGNKRNGKGSKRLKTTSGDIILSTPQDRQGSFTPQIVKKRETVLADNLAPQIIGPVSYTHLDVYKRQALNRTILELKLGKIHLCQRIPAL